MLDLALLRDKAERDRILAHEIFHFVWWKLGRVRRAGYEDWIAGEMRDGVPGEMGWSADWRKSELQACDLVIRSRRWREYLCESFCDSTAALIVPAEHPPEITLSARARRRRLLCLEELLPWDRLST